MGTNDSSARHPRRTPLAACLAAALALAAVPAVAAHPAHTAATLPVTNCNDDGSSGSLRAVIDAANDGDTVDLSALTCSTITLQSGAIVIAVDDLTLSGPGTSLTIQPGTAYSSVFEHTGSGTLAIDSLRIAYGFKYQTGQSNALGGCIFSAGNVSLDGAEVTRCLALRSGADAGYYAKGGAIYAQGNVTLIDSSVTYSGADAGDAMQPMPGSAVGGGIYARGSVELLYSTVMEDSVATTTLQGSANYGGVFAGLGFTSKYSTVSYCSAAMFSPAISLLQTTGGGVGVISGNVEIEGSTISGNSAGTFGGIVVRGGGTTSITNSTIAGNYAAYGYGGIAVVRGISVSTLVAIANSTITRNLAHAQAGAGGLFLGDGMSLDLQSTIIGGNASGGTYANDLDAPSALTVTGANNLVETVGPNIALPGGTLRTDPQLGPLQDNGGLTRTLAPLVGSPVIDMGNNTAGLDTDQRRTGFARVVGAAADIGAFETDPDVLFANGFN